MVTTILTTTELEIEAPAAVGHVPTLCVFTWNSIYKNWVNLQRIFNFAKAISVFLHDQICQSNP